MDDGTKASGALDGRSASLIALIVAALCGAGAVLLGAWLLARAPDLPTQWRLGADGQVELVDSSHPELRPHRAKGLTGAQGAGVEMLGVDALVLHRSPRWIVDDSTRTRHAELHDAVHGLLGQPSLGLVFADGAQVTVPVQARGLAGLGAIFWLLSGFGLLLYGAVVVMLLSQRTSGSVLFALMSLCQLGNLALTAVESAHGFGLPSLLRTWDLQARLVDIPLEKSGWLNLVANAVQTGGQRRSVGEIGVAVGAGDARLNAQRRTVAYDAEARRAVVMAPRDARGRP